MSILIDNNLVSEQNEQVANSRLAIPNGFSYLSDEVVEAIRVKHGLADASEVIDFLGFAEVEDESDELIVEEV